MMKLSESQGFSAHWRLLAEALGFLPAEIERLRDSGSKDSERCYQLLRWWDQKNLGGATVAVLAEGVHRVRNNIMLEVTHSIFYS